MESSVAPRIEVVSDCHKRASNSKGKRKEVDSSLGNPFQSLDLDGKSPSIFVHPESVVDEAIAMTTVKDELTKRLLRDAFIPGRTRTAEEPGVDSLETTSTSTLESTLARIRARRARLAAVLSSTSPATSSVAVIDTTAPNTARLHDSTTSSTSQMDPAANHVTATSGSPNKGRRIAPLPKRARSNTVQGSSSAPTSAVPAMGATASSKAVASDPVTTTTSATAAGIVYTKVEYTTFAAAAASIGYVPAGAPASYAAAVASAAALLARHTASNATFSAAASAVATAATAAAAAATAAAARAAIIHGTAASGSITNGIGVTAASGPMTDEIAVASSVIDMLARNDAFNAAFNTVSSAAASAITTAATTAAATAATTAVINAVAPAASTVATAPTATASLSPKKRLALADRVIDMATAQRHMIEEMIAQRKYLSLPPI